MAFSSFCLILGIDLAGSPHRPTGLCFFQEMEVSTQLAYENQEIISLIKEKKPDLVAIDAPLSLPLDRSRNKAPLRACDEELRRRRIPFFPPTLGPMRQLTERGSWLRKKIEAMGIKVIEVYPGAAQDIWGLPRARRGPGKLRQGLQKMGLKGLRKKMTAHELDAATAALVGYYYLQGKAEEIGAREEGLIILPLKDRP